MSRAGRDKAIKELEEYYEELTEEKILKEWKRQGRTARDWIKSKVIFFDEN